MKLPLIYLSVFLVLGYIFLVDHSGRAAYVPLPEGLLYSTDTSSQTILNTEVTEKILFKRTAEDEYLTIEANSTAALPAKVLVRFIESKDAKYKLLTAVEVATLAERPTTSQTPLKQAPKAVKRAPVRTTEQVQAGIMAVTVQKEAPPENLNINKVRGIVNTSDKTYFFTSAEKTLNEVSLKVKSVTPWQGQSVLALELSNDLPKYFFISNIAVTAGGTPLQVKTFNDPFVSGNKTVGIFILTRLLKGESVAVKLSESAGGGRNFDVLLSIP